MRARESSPSGALRRWVPRWWGGEGGAAGWVLDRLLWPAEGVFRGVVALRNRAYDSGVLRVAEPSIPVISVGNLAVGGSGKTPVTAWIAGRLEAWGRKPAVVLRGYAEDEMLVHRELNPRVPLYAARRRAEAVAAAAAAGRGVAVVDDGFQHRALGRHLDLALISAEGWRDPQRLLPRGPWREALPALARAGLVVVTRKSGAGEDPERVAAKLRDHVPPERIVRCRIAPTGLSPLRSGAGEEHGLEWLRGREVVAVASLADPVPFVQNLQEAGAGVELLAYPDHHPFDASDAERVAERAAGRPLVMTRKEAVKLRALIPASAQGWVLEQRVDFGEDEHRIEAALQAAMNQ